MSDAEIFKGDLIEVYSSADDSLFPEICLVLDAYHIDYFVQNKVADNKYRCFQILVTSRDYNYALKEIGDYLEEKKWWPPVLEAPFYKSRGSSAAIPFCVFLILAFIFQLSFSFGFDWIAEGRASSKSIINGEWWRVFTALFLHADAHHLISNLVLGTFFIYYLSEEIGAGLACLGVLFSGALGNAMNAFFQDLNHNSIGSSTAVFGAIGLMSTIAVIKNRKYRLIRIRAWRSMIIGLLIFSLLGVGGKDTDVWAHVFGLISGVFIAAFFYFFLRKFPYLIKIQMISGLISFVFVLTTWYFAFYS